MKHNELTEIAYLEQMLNWENFCKAHPKFPVALREVLNELYYLKNKVNRNETHT